MQERRRALRATKPGHGGDMSGRILTSDDNTSQQGSRSKRWRVGCLVCAPVVLTSALCLILYAVLDVPIDAVAYSLPAPQSLDEFKSNLSLSSAERVYYNELRGPESLFMHKGHLYTGTSDGKVLDIVNGKIRVLTTFGKPPCGSIADEPRCGRPLGLRLHPNGYLIVIDSYLGIFQVNISTGDHRLLLSTKTKINGVELSFLNDLDIDSDGMIYVTHSSSKWTRRHFLYCALEGRPTGRLIRFDPVANTTRVLVEKMRFANGVQLSEDESFVLVTELVMARVHRYYLKGANAGSVDIFADNLPLLPDNIRPSQSGGYWIGSSIPRGQGFSLIESLTTSPWVRNTMAQFFPPTSILLFLSLRATIVELGPDGHIVRVIADENAANMRTASEVHDEAGVLYIGSFVAPFIARLDTRDSPSL